MLKLALFSFISVMTVVFAFMVVLSRHIFRAAFSLMGTLCGIAGLIALYDNYTVAALQVLIYVGGVFVLFLFSILVTEDIEKAIFRRKESSIYVASIYGVIILSFLILAAITPYFTKEFWSASMTLISAKELGASFLSTNLLAFEVVSVLLLASLVASIILIRKEIEE